MKKHELVILILFLLYLAFSIPWHIKHYAETAELLRTSSELANHLESRSFTDAFLALRVAHKINEGKMDRAKFFLNDSMSRFYNEYGPDYRPQPGLDRNELWLLHAIRTEADKDALLARTLK